MKTISKNLYRLGHLGFNSGLIIKNIDEIIKKNPIM
jgi:hypothetical protein